MGNADDFSVKIPKDLLERITSKIQGTEFESVESYVLFVLREVLADEPSSQPYSEKDQERIEARLRSLGYV
jgi:Arc/MetJ-type ribon-helix-helix transcriptional regulator